MQLISIVIIFCVILSSKATKYKCTGPREIEIELKDGKIVHPGYQFNVATKEYISTSLTGTMPTKENFKDTYDPRPLEVDLKTFSSDTDFENFQKSEFGVQFEGRQASIGISSSKSSSKKKTGKKSITFLKIHGDTTTTGIIDTCQGFRGWFTPPIHAGTHSITGITNGVLLTATISTVFDSETERSAFESSIAANVPSNVGSVGLHYSHSNGNVKNIAVDSSDVQIKGDIPPNFHWNGSSSSIIGDLFEALIGWIGKPKRAIAKSFEFFVEFCNCTNCKNLYPMQVIPYDTLLKVVYFCEENRNIEDLVYRKFSSVETCFSFDHNHKLIHQSQDLVGYCNVVLEKSEALFKNRFTKDVYPEAAALMSSIRKPMHFDPEYFEAILKGINFAVKAKREHVHCILENSPITNNQPCYQKHYLLIVEILKADSEEATTAYQELMNLMSTGGAFTRASIVISTTETMSLTRKSYLNKPKELQCAQTIEE